ncbi:hypothetical protein OPT61_g6325 [Boeremia exigua]|uniref:Uncharacterized protein n=1 Tax=Boeremia exigua TaxID=749465 RepID=A0ACC2I709_9PLEO|nr:hypothetical protein OPT61_g6325 [Boeremia exigua]
MTVRCIPTEAKLELSPTNALWMSLASRMPYTNKDSKDCGEFVRETIARMKAACKINCSNDKGDWTNLRECAIDCMKEYMQRMGSRGSINLAELVQFVTLKTSQIYLFTDAEIASKTKDTFEDFRFIGHRLNDLWMNSKTPDGERLQWADQHDLHVSLRRVTSATSIDMPGSYIQETYNGAEPTVLKENPLNFILPAYETMWRVVLRCFIEVHLRNAPNSSTWRLVLADFLGELSNPDCMPDAFYRDSVTGLRPSDIAKEALRLYLPSRHVYRDFDGKLFCADIEACHRSHLLSGDNPLLFSPERWSNICPKERAEKVADKASNAKTKALKNSEQDLGYVPFATYCPADKRETRAFAMKTITMLVAVLGDGLDGEWRLAEVDNLRERGIPLESDRSAYGKLELRTQKGSTLVGITL